jgi:GH24 family phage-related lysozyme (muramidase)
MANPVLRLHDKGADVAVAQDLLNRGGALLNPDGDFGGGTDTALREFQAAVSLPVTGVIDDATWECLRATPEPSPDIPTRAVNFIAQVEVTNRQHYDAACARPTWPKGESGVTIGVGYDLGYQAGFEVDWKDLLTPTQIAALRPWLGKKGKAAEPAVAQLAAIHVPWRSTWMVFIHKTLPREVVTTRQTFHGPKPLSPLCLGALVSLVLNRGPGMVDAAPGDRRREMRQIRDALAADRPQDVPPALRAMGRLWPDAKGLRDRREAEARLFEDGLAQS